MMHDVIWKSFKLGDIFLPVTGRDSNIAQKNLNKLYKKTDEYNISIITETSLNNGVGFYMSETDEILKSKIVNKGLTYGTQFGNVNYHNYRHFIIGNTNYLKFIHNNLEKLCNDYIGNFFAKIISKMFRKSNLFGFVNKIDQNMFKREIILLPCLEVSKEDHYI